MKYSLSFLLIISIFFNSNAQSWSQIGPEGGYFKEFTIHPTNANIIYAGSDDGGGVWKSIDGGSTWTMLTSEFPNMTGWKVVIDENSTDVVYSCDLYGRYGVLKSTDGGSSWSLINSGLSSVYDKMVSGLVVKTSDTLFISTGESASPPPIPVRPGNGMYKSYDGGLTWIAAGLQGMTVPSIGKNEFGTIFAGSEDNGLLYSNDNGATWLTHAEIPAVGTIYEIETESNVILVASSEGVFISTNWGINFAYLGLAGEFNFDACLHAISPEVEIYSSTMTGLKHFSSGTGFWTTVAGSFFVDQLVIGIASDGTSVYCGGFSNSPIVKSNDGGVSWNELASSPVATELTDVYIDPSNSDRILTCTMGSYSFTGDFDRESIYETTDGGLNWLRKGPDAHGLCLTVNPLNDQAFYLGSFGQGVYKTTDNFNTFSQLSPNGVTVVDVIVSSEDTNVVLISELNLVPIPVSGSILRSTDGGANFSIVSSIIANRILFNPTNNDSVYVATGAGLYLSIDNGLTFAPWLLASEDCLTLAARGDDLYTGTNDGKLFKVSNAVATDISGSWNTPVEIKSILFEGDDLFVGLNGAEKDTIMDLQGSVWRSSDFGSTWSDITTDMTSTNIYGNNIIVSDGSELFIGTYGGGIFKSSGLNFDAGLQEMNTSLDVSIHPNPSSNLVVLRSKTSKIDQFKVVASDGSDVSNKVDQISSFNEELVLDISSLDNGIYTIQLLLQSDKSTSVKLIKN